jgi:hypothetical protein
VTNWTPVQPLSDEPQDLAYWEPWQPKIGDRVRVRLSGECNVIGPGREDPFSPVASAMAHPAHQDGVVGIVTQCHSACTGGGAHAVGHHIRVEYLHPRGWRHMGHFAACELELLDP